MTRLVLVTGATGFVGRPLIKHLADAGDEVVAVSRTGERIDGATRSLAHTDIVSPLPAEVLAGVDAVVHLAGIAHRGRAADPSEYDRVNNLGTVAVAEAAIEAGVATFVFLSTSKVHGAVSRSPFRAGDPFDPPDAYSAAKAAAETTLQGMTDRMRVVSLRPPVIYGPNPKANVRLLASLAGRGLPLPAGDRTARRSMVHIDNLCSAVLRVIEKTDGPSGGYVLADGPAITTPDLYRRLCKSFGTTARFVPLNGPMLRIADRVIAPLLGRQPFEPLYSNFEVDGSAFTQDYGWTPAGDFDTAIEDVVASLR
ncbi:MAG: NAD-dependent epimerase/dehydratase family protein [Actinomycetota bacterium]